MSIKFPTIAGGRGILTWVTGQAIVNVARVYLEDNEIYFIRRDCSCSGYIVNTKTLRVVSSEFWTYHDDYDDELYAGDEIENLGEVTGWYSLED